MAIFTVRLTDQEFNRWKSESAAAGISMGLWVRNKCAAKLGLRDIDGEETRVASSERLPQKTCKHGRGKGYNCGLCGGMAVME